MKKNEFVKLTLANGGETAIIRTEHIAFAMPLTSTNDENETMRFTRIIPRNLIISPDSNWIDVKESPEEIMKLI